MILVGMRQGHDVDSPDAAFPQIRRDHILADVELGRRTPAESRDSATVHQHPFAIGKDDQDAVALADVDDAHLQFPRMKLRRKWMPDQ